MVFLIACIAAFAVAMVVLVGLLIVRRWRMERRRDADTACLADVTRSYLRRLSSDEDTGPDRPDPAVGLQAVLHLARLLRGAERTRLIAFADDDGLTDYGLARIVSGSARTRMDGLRIAEQIASVRCITALRDMMVADPNEDIQSEAAAALARLDHLPSARETVKILDLDDGYLSPVDRAIVRSLARSDSNDLKHMVEEVASSKLREAIVEALGGSGDRTVVELLSRSARNPDPGMRVAALAAASKLGDPATSEWVIAALEDVDISTRVAAADACWRLGLRQALPALRAMMDERDWRVRLSARRAVASMEPASAAHLAA